MSEFKERFDEVPKDKQVLVYCHHGKDKPTLEQSDMPK
jgi:hypothetical protein